LARLVSGVKAGRFSPNSTWLSDVMVIVGS
jgi:hypothetical protein